MLNVWMSWFDHVMYSRSVTQIKHRDTIENWASVGQPVNPWLFVED